MELARAAKIVEADGADIIDFNMGCPVPKIVNNGEGSALMKNPQLAYEILARMADSVKFRLLLKYVPDGTKKILTLPKLHFWRKKQAWQPLPCTAERANSITTAKQTGLL